MKQQVKKEKSNVFARIATLLVPIVVILLIGSVVAYFMLRDNPRTGMLAVAMPLIATILAVVGIILAVISTKIDSSISH
jgi:di/tricarboxylate transporter